MGKTASKFVEVETNTGIYSNSVDRSKTTQGLNTLVNQLYAEVYGDVL